MEQPSSEKVKKFIAGYLLTNGYSETLECFKKEADLTNAEVNPVVVFEGPQKDGDPSPSNDGHVGIRIDNKSAKQRNFLTKVRRFPFFIVAITLVQCGAFLAKEHIPYAHTIVDSPLFINPNRYESKCFKDYLSVRNFIFLPIFFALSCSQPYFSGRRISGAY